MPPQPGNQPLETSGELRIAVEDASLKSQAKASSKPPPMAYPLINATVGLPIVSILLLISFPIQMTSWQPPLALVSADLGFSNIIATIFTGFTDAGYSVEQLRTSIDGFTMATPLDSFKTDIGLGFTTFEIIEKTIFILKPVYVPVPVKQKKDYPKNLKYKMCNKKQKNQHSV